MTRYVAAAVLVLLVVGFAIIPTFMTTYCPMPLSMRHSTLRMLATALQDYRSDQGAYPPHVPFRTTVEGKSELLPKGAKFCHSLSHHLTTPVPYITSLPGQSGVRDAENDPPFAYYCEGSDAVLIGTGPDKDFDVRRVRDLVSAAPESSGARQHADQWRFDPTNGSHSSGDLWIVLRGTQGSAGEFGGN